MRTDKERPEENTCRIVKGLDAVWAYFCPSKPCLSLSTDGTIKKHENGAARMDCTAKIRSIQFIFCAESKNIFALLLPPFAAVCYALFPSRVMYDKVRGQQHDNGTHADDRICINAALRFGLEPQRVGKAAGILGKINERAAVCKRFLRRVRDLA